MVLIIISMLKIHFFFIPVKVFWGHHSVVAVSLEASFSKFPDWSLMRGLVISLAVNIANHYRSREKSRNN